MDKGPALANAVQTMAAAKDDIQRDVAASKSQEDQRACLEICASNFDALDKVPAVVSAITQDGEALFVELKDAVRVLLVPRDVGEDQVDFGDLENWS